MKLLILLLSDAAFLTVSLYFISKVKLPYENPTNRPTRCPFDPEHERV
jgi:hypothetical protein